MTMKSLILLLGVVVAVCGQRRPPNYSQEYMPETSFDCRDKILGGYYADLETDCQMFHVCVKVPGIGVQDFRFLCPNDTSFDQENQICASWYEVNCDANILFYSDNFDLYRIGYSPSSPALPSSSANPIPLGPSTVRPAVRPRPRPQSRPQEDEEEFYLQRSDTGDRRLQQGKDLRSSSSNYFGRNKGKDEDYSTDAYLKKTAKPYKPVVPTTPAAPTTFVTDSPTTTKKKVAVRKLRKRPQQQQQQQQQQVNYQQAEEYTTVASYNQGAYRGQNYNSQRNYDYTTQAPSSTNYNTYTPRYNTIQRNGNSQPTTQGSSSSFPVDQGSYQQNDYNSNNYNFAQRSSSSKPAEYTTTPAPSYQTVQRKTPDYSTTTLQSSAPSNFYQGNTASSGTYQSTPSEYTNKNYNYDFSTYTSTSAPASYDQYNYQQTASRSANKPTTTSEPAYIYQTTSEAYKYDGYNFQKTVQAQFNAQPSGDDESLKTAQSSNYGPSSFNNYNTYDNKAKPTVNQTNNYYTSSATPKSSAFSNTQKTSTASYDAYTTKPASSYYSAPSSTPAPPRPFSAAYSPTAPPASRLPPAAVDTRTSTAFPRRSPTTPTPATSTKSLKDVSYDYAYYDETNTEYDGLDPISDHHFGKGRESFKVARSATR